MGQWLQRQDGQRKCIYPPAAANAEIQLPPWMQSGAQVGAARYARRPPSP